MGFFVTFETGYTLYFRGSTDLTLDRRLWGELFRPDADGRRRALDLTNVLDGSP